jgi:hypothetical protein
MQHVPFTLHKKYVQYDSFVTCIIHTFTWVFKLYFVLLVTKLYMIPDSYFWLNHEETVPK